MLFENQNVDEINRYIETSEEDMISKTIFVSE